MLFRHLVRWTALWAFSTVSLLAGQATQVIFEAKNSDSNTVEQGLITSEGDRLHVQFDEDQAMIFRLDKKLVWVLQPEEKSYIEMTEEGMNQMADRLNQAMKQMEQQLAQLPPEQRELMKKYMQGRFPAAAQPAQKPERRISDAGETRTIGSFSCTVYEVFRGDEKVSELCMVPYSKLEGTEQIANAFASLGAFYQRLLDSLSQWAQEASPVDDLDLMQRLEGFPVQVRRFEDGKVRMESTFKEIRSLSVDSNFFEVDPSFRKIDPMKGLR